MILAPASPTQSNSEYTLAFSSAPAGAPGHAPTGLSLLEKALGALPSDEEMIALAAELGSIPRTEPWTRNAYGPPPFGTAYDQETAPGINNPL